MYSQAEEIAAIILTGDKNNAGILHHRFCDFISGVQNLANEDLSKQTVALAITMWELQTGFSALCKG